MADREVLLPRQKGTVYTLLNGLSDRIGYSFVYDSGLFPNDRECLIEKGSYTVREAVRRITGNDTLCLSVRTGHILLHLPKEEPAFPLEPPARHAPEPPLSCLQYRGRILDKVSRRPVTQVTVAVRGFPIGTVSNQLGEFVLSVPDTLKGQPIVCSHIGYALTEWQSGRGKETECPVIWLEPALISLQEVVVRAVRPEEVLTQMLARRSLNYHQQAVGLQVFYREGTHLNKKPANTSEGIMSVYKAGWATSESDQIRLEKMRSIRADSRLLEVTPKLEGGVHTPLALDIMHILPEFLRRENWSQYLFTHSDITVFEERLVNVISFEPRPEIKEPLFCGELYVDTEDYALLHASFRIHPDYVGETASRFVRKKSRKLAVVPRDIGYSVTYRQYDGRYYLYHVRGDLYFSVRPRWKLFPSTMHAWFEMVSTGITTGQVAPVARGERLKYGIFLETRHEYDEAFWQGFSFIPSEEQIRNMDSYRLTLPVENQP